MQLHIDNNNILNMTLFAEIEACNNVAPWDTLEL